jgi:hypothetical protein
VAVAGEYQKALPNIRVAVAVVVVAARFPAQKQSPHPQLL